MRDIDKWLQAGAIVPVTNETVHTLIEHIKNMYGKETEIVFTTHISWDIGWNDVKTTSRSPANLKLMFDKQTGQLKSAEMI
jgi:hypothetical protein